ncbi:MAG: hypothetical protein NTZ42_04845 [Candidatus Gribaldobacteria bacterium]|nr:hypothetical protein [Candidatus Gribaldobacteria bacterium]
MILKKIIFIVLLIVIAFYLFYFFAVMGLKPKIILWAWEGPENMMFLEYKNNVTVAFYAGGIEIRDGEIIIKSRANPLIVDPQKKLTAVIRIDNFSTREDLEKYTPQISEFIVKKCQQKNVFHCQIDFDAKESERKAYKEIILNVKKGLPSCIDISITALVSWCSYDNWIKDLPISEAVPMFYSLGLGEEYVKRNFKLREKKCAKSIGVSLDESLPVKKYIEGKKIYIFSANPWTEESFLKAVELLK